MSNDTLQVEKDEKYSRNIWRILANVSIVSFVIICLFSYYYHKNTVNKFIEISSLETARVAKMLAEKDNNIKQKTSEIQKIKAQIEGIKDKNDLLKRDIELYIKTTHPKVSTVVAHSIAENVVDLSREYKISPELVVGIIKVESAFDPMAVGPKTKYGHARGLMQVMPEWVKKLELKSEYDFHEIDIAIESGIKVFLIHLEEGKGDISTGLYLYVNKNKEYVGNVYAAMGKFVAFRSIIGEDTQNIETDIDHNGDSKQIEVDKKEDKNGNGKSGNE